MAKSLSTYMDLLVATGALSPSDRQKIIEQIIDSVVDAVDNLPSFNQKSAYDMGSRDMRYAIIKEIQGLKR